MMMIVTSLQKKTISSQIKITKIEKLKKKTYFKGKEKVKRVKNKSIIYKAKSKLMDFRVLSRSERVVPR